MFCANYILLMIGGEMSVSIPFIDGCTSITIELIKMPQLRQTALAPLSIRQRVGMQCRKHFLVKPIFHLVATILGNRQAETGHIVTPNFRIQTSTLRGIFERILVLCSEN